MSHNTADRSWPKCLRSDCWKQRYTLCVMGIIGCTCMSASGAMFYHVMEYLDERKRVSQSVYYWAGIERSFAKASYFIGFFASSIPGGILVEILGGKFLYSIGCSGSGLGTILTPFLANNGGIAAVVVLRIFVGAAEALTIPASLKLLSKWLPSEERGLFVGIFLMAPQIGLIVGYYSSGYMLAKLYWPFCFYIWGGISVVHCIFFNLLCYSDPQSHPFISRKELKFLNVRMREDLEDPILTVLRLYMKSARVWCAIISGFGFYWCYFSIVVDLPRYVHYILHFHYEKAGVMIAVPFILMFALGLSSCQMIAYVLRRNFVDTLKLRTMCTFLSSVPSAVSILSAYYIGSARRALTVCLFAVALICLSFYLCGLLINTLKFNSRSLILFFAVINTFGGIAAAAAPIMHGYITSDEEEAGWVIVGWVCFLILILGVVINLAFLRRGRVCCDSEAYRYDLERMQIRFADVETGKENKRNSKQKKIDKNDEDEDEKIEVEQEDAGMDAVSSMNNNGNNENPEIKGILKKHDLKADQQKTDSTSSRKNKEGAVGRKTRGRRNLWKKKKERGGNGKRVTIVVPTAEKEIEVGHTGT